MKIALKFVKAFPSPLIFRFGQMNKVQAYNILGVKEQISYDELKKIYLKLSKKYHPDLNPNDPTSINRFKEINEAYSILKHFHKSFEEAGQAFSIQKSKYNKYDGKISKEDFNVFKKYKNEKMQKNKDLDLKKFDEIEKEWDKNEEQIFFDIFGKSFQEAPDLFYDEKNQNLREIYEEEMEKLFNKKFSYLFSAEEKFKEKITEAQIKNPAKSTDKKSAKERFFKIFKK